jgi:hypothetical protein
MSATMRLNLLVITKAYIDEAQKRVSALPAREQQALATTCVALTTAMMSMLQTGIVSVDIDLNEAAL